MKGETMFAAESAKALTLVGVIMLLASALNIDAIAKVMAAGFQWVR